MTKDAARLLEDALRLKAEDRARLAEELLASLDEAEQEVEQAWANEIARRAAEARANAGDEEDWRSALADIQREVLSR
ncbi:MAG TPA: addiction module protein [Thermoanaerobaculia bacterium]|nr:addiction module protein [Thermoanaerobaculia bacterium]